MEEKVKKKKKGGQGRTRNFATAVYPESAPQDWQVILAEQCVPAFISPLHDKDVNPTGEPKKPHYHVMIMFDGVKTSEQAREVFDLIGGVGTEVVKSLRGYARYLCHLDNPEKHQYNVDDVVSLAGAEYRSIIGLATDKYVAIGEMMDFCILNQIMSYAQLLVYARHNREDWFRVLVDSSTMVMKEFLKSYAWSNKENVSIEEITGEVL